MTSFKEWLELRGYAKSTIKQYLCLEHIAPALTQEAVNTFLQAHKGSLPKAFLRLYLHDYLGEKVIEIPRQRGRAKERIPKYITHAEFDQFRIDPNVPERERLMARIAWGLGLRASSILAITPRAINIERGILRGIGKGNKEFEVNIPPALLDSIVRYYKTNCIPPTERLFKIGYHRASVLILKYTEQVLGKPYSLHKFRHGIATHMHQSGVDLPIIQAFLQHKNIVTTAIYTHGIPHNSQNIINKVRGDV